MIRSSLTYATALTALFISQQASAITCAEIMNMVNVNVPPNIVQQTMEASGTRFTADDIRCLSEQGAPPELVEAARKMAMDAESTTATPIITNDPDPEPDPGDFGDQGFTGDFEADSAEGSDEDDGGGGPQRLEQLVKLYRAKKVLTASKGFYDLLEADEYPEYESKIHYYLAKALFDLEMYHSAQFHFMQVVRKGPRNPYFKYALPKLVAIARLTGNDIELLRIVHKIPPEAFPRQARNHLYYLMGRKLYADGELSASAKYFQQISSKSSLYLRSKYFEGVIHNERGKLKSAVKAFRDVYQAEINPNNDREVQEMQDLQDLALVNIARIYYGLERFENAGNYYDMVDHDSTYWAESLFEHAWAEFMVSDLNDSLGLLLTLRSPYYADHEHLPETVVLRALNFFNLCNFDDAEKTLLDFESKYTPMKGELEEFLERYRGKQGLELSDQAYDTYFTERHHASKLDKSVFLRVLRNRDLAALVRHMDMMDRETALIDSQKGVWRDTLGAHLKKQIEQDRARYKKNAGKLLLAEMAFQKGVLDDLMGQSKIIRFEVVDAQRADYEYKASAPQVDTLEDKVVDFATSKDIIYWPFNGEFWQDELGYYRYAEADDCK